MKLQCDFNAYSVIKMSSSDEDMVVAFMYLRYKKQKKKKLGSSILFTQRQPQFIYTNERIRPRPS